MSVVVLKERFDVAMRFVRKGGWPFGGKAIFTWVSVLAEKGQTPFRIKLRVSIQSRVARDWHAVYRTRHGILIHASFTLMCFFG